MILARLEDKEVLQEALFNLYWKAWNMKHTVVLFIVVGLAVLVFVGAYRVLSRKNPAQSGDGKVAQTSVEKGFRITEPKDGDAVPVSATIRGVTDDPDAKIWVVVFPVGLLAPGTIKYWVQVQAVVNKEDGTWSCSPVFFGEAGKHEDKLFEFRAVANPESTLRPGDILAKYPKAEKQTTTVSVKGGP